VVTRKKLRNHLQILVITWYGRDMPRLARIVRLPGRFTARESAAPVDSAELNLKKERGAELTVVDEGGAPGSCERSISAGAAERVDLELFTVGVQRREDVAIVTPRGELDLATVEALEVALDRIGSAARLVLDLRGLSFIDSTGLHLLVALHRRAKAEGFELVMAAPAAPVDRAIKVCGLDRVLPLVAAVDGVDNRAGASASAARGGS
jgi:anti-sigma B factor antagonist